MKKRKQDALISVRVTNKFKKDYEELAADKGLTLPELVKYILMQYLEIEKRNTLNMYNDMSNKMNNIFGKNMSNLNNPKNDRNNSNE